MVELFIACGLYAGARAIAVCSTASEKKDHQNESDCNCALRFFWTPVKVLYFIAYYGIPNIGYGSVAYNTSVVFVCLDSCVNPFVYSFQNERFRTGLRDLFRHRETKMNNAHLGKLGVRLGSEAPENRTKRKFPTLCRCTTSLKLKTPKCKQQLQKLYKQVTFTIFE